MTRTTTFAPVPFPAPLRARLVRRLAALHAEEPFGPQDVRGTARRVVEAVTDLGLEPVIVRGGVDVVGAELDHVFVVVGERVVDVALPVCAADFAETLRAWVAGDVDIDELVAVADRHGLEDRVVGDYPTGLRYHGAPLWGTAA